MFKWLKKILFLRPKLVYIIKLKGITLILDKDQVQKRIIWRKK